MVKASSSLLIESRWCLAVFLHLWALLFEHWHVGLAQLLFSLLSSGEGQGDLCRPASRSFIGLPSPPAWGCCTQHSSRHALWGSPEPCCCWRLKTTTFCPRRDFNTSVFNVSLSRDFSEMTPFLGSTSLHVKGFFLGEGMEAKQKATQKKEFAVPRPGPNGPYALSWYGRLRGLNSPLMVFKCVQLWQHFFCVCRCLDSFWTKRVASSPYKKMFASSPYKRNTQLRLNTSSFVTSLPRDFGDITPFYWINMLAFIQRGSLQRGRFWRRDLPWNHKRWSFPLPFGECHSRMVSESSRLRVCHSWWNSIPFPCP